MKWEQTSAQFGSVNKSSGSAARVSLDKEGTWAWIVETQGAHSTANGFAESEYSAKYAAEKVLAELESGESEAALAKASKLSGYEVGSGEPIPKKKE